MLFQTSLRNRIMIQLSVLMFLNVFVLTLLNLCFQTRLVAWEKITQMHIDDMSKGIKMFVSLYKN